MIHESLIQIYIQNILKINILYFIPNRKKFHQFYFFHAYSNINLFFSPCVYIREFAINLANTRLQERDNSIFSIYPNSLYFRLKQGLNTGYYRDNNCRMKIINLSQNYN